MHKRYHGHHFDWQIVGLFGFSLVMVLLAGLGLREVVEAALHVANNLNR